MGIRTWMSDPGEPHGRKGLTLVGSGVGQKHVDSEGVLVDKVIRAGFNTQTLVSLRSKRGSGFFIKARVGS